MDAAFFQELGLPKPKHKLDVGSGTHAEQTAKIMVGVEKILMQDKPDEILVQGDTNTVLGCALAAAKLNIAIGHVEAGLRSHDRTMPEETNRIVTDHLSRHLFAPTLLAKNNLIREGISEEMIRVTGNTVADAVFQNIEIAEKHETIFRKLDVNPNEYFLLTAHRQENVDEKVNVERLFKGLSRLYTVSKVPILFPVHPRTLKRLNEFSIPVPEGVRLIKPLGYLDFLLLEKNARLILTDSGGVQEEACILQVPCLTLRENTERPETLEVGGNVLVGLDPERIVAGALAMLQRNRSWSNPFGDGRSGKRIVDILLDHH